jgi:hypothetical protein
MLLRLSHVLVILALIACAVIVAQSPKPRDGENKFHGVVLTFVSQRCVARNKVPYVGDDFIDFSDLTTRFRLANTGTEEIFYLADDITTAKEPVGFQLFRPTKNADWEAIYSPARGREGIFTGDAFKWMLLRPGSAIEFDPEDVSDKVGDHATSVFLNTKPVHTNRVELVSNAFSPVRCHK